ncbi:hypothetical protein VP01_62g2 [Puccinia sorghi]|uniref:Uncharacterized protein n=1 Tax=Puccinia sorghi TaxID=27349 RepID=A0A0L6UH23_9BASI|nr:hypothetical protein VP01_62g2 [Puccinia sorghi]
MAERQTHTLRNPLASPDEPTPSALDGVHAQLEAELRLYDFCLIFPMVLFRWGALDPASRRTTQTAPDRNGYSGHPISAVLFCHLVCSFWYTRAIFLASKLEEKPARIRDIINVYDYLIQFIEWSREQVSTPVQVERDGAVTASRVAREAEQKIQDNPLLPVEIKQN